MVNSNPSYTKSTAGGTADGTSWTNGFLTIQALSAADAAGETQYVSQSHAESTAGTVTYSGAGTNASPTKLVCANDGATPPTALATTATVTTTGANSITMNGSFYTYGISFISGAGIKLASSAANFQRLESCNLHYTGSSTSFWGPPGLANVGTRIDLVNCGLKFLSTTSQPTIGGVVNILGGSVLSGSSNLAGAMFLFGGGDRCYGEMNITGFDATNAVSTQIIFATNSGGSCRGMIRSSKLPASWSGSLVSGTLQPGQRFEMHNCDSADTNYRIWIEDYAGTIKSETTIVRTSGASDGTTPLSWKMVTSANSSYPTVPLVSPEIAFWNDTTGASKTVTVEIVHDTNVAGGQGAGTANAFRDDEVWLEVDYMGTSGFPLATPTSDRVAGFLTAPADQASSSAAWTTTGLTTPVKQALAVTFTPVKKGYFIARVIVAKASRTIYIDPVLTVT